MTTISKRHRDLCLCRKTIIEMCKDRGYVTDQKVLELDDFIVQFPNACTDIKSIRFVCHKDNIPIGIHFIDDDKVGKSVIERIIETYKSMNIYHVILITTHKMSSASQNIVLSNEFKIEVFKDEELLFNITKHELVPRHRILNDIEKQQVIKKYKIKVEQMPKILKADPVCKYLGAESGDVIEIIRNSKTAGTSIYYKIVEDKLIKV